MTRHELWRVWLPRLALTAVGVFAIAPVGALAQQPDAAQALQADALFAGGKEAMAARDYARACTLLQDSYRLDPATGSLLALAICHEWEGKLASAFREYNEVVVRSQADARPDREKAARERAAALQGVVSTLTLSAAPETDVNVLTVRLDDVLLDPSVFGTAIPVDGGAHVVSASAAGMQTWSVSVSVAPHHDAQTVTMPALVAVPPPSVARAGTPRVVPIVRPIAAPPQHDSQVRAFSGLQWAGVVGVTAGILTLGAGGILTLGAIHDNNVENSGCNDQGCVEDPPQKRLRLGPAANISLAAGGALTVAGVVMLMVGRRQGAAASAREHALLVAPWAAETSAGAVVHGSF